MFFGVIARFSILDMLLFYIRDATVQVFHGSVLFAVLKSRFGCRAPGGGAGGRGSELIYVKRNWELMDSLTWELDPGSCTSNGLGAAHSRGSASAPTNDSRIT